MFYDINKTLSYNALFNFIVGNRGSGKTYGFKDWAIRDFLKNQAQFMYVRRYKDEHKDIGKFFSDICMKYPDHEFKTDGKTFKIDNKEAGHAVALSTSQIKKSTAYPLVNKIALDEFIIDKGHYRYLQDEVIKFLDLYETVARLRDDVRVFFLSNAISQTNPYFLYFKLELPTAKNNIRRMDDILIELVQNAEFIEKKKNTRFGKLIQGTPYADYSIENKFLRDNKTFIEKKSPKATYYLTFKYKGNLYGVWIDYSRGDFFVSENVDPSSRYVFSITLDDHSPNTMLLKRLSQANLFKPFLESYKSGHVYFETMDIKNITYEVIRLTIL